MITIATPIGPFTMTGNGVAITSARFGVPEHPGPDVGPPINSPRQRARLGPEGARLGPEGAGLGPGDARPGSEGARLGSGDAISGLVRGEVPQDAVDAVRSYFDGDIEALDRVLVAQSGTPFLERCWAVLRTVTTPITYTDFARLTGTGVARAAAQGCARNQIALLVPCHRVLRVDGSLGGYRWGLDVKRWLIAHEANSY